MILPPGWEPCQKFKVKLCWDIGQFISSSLLHTEMIKYIEFVSTKISKLVNFFVFPFCVSRLSCRVFDCEFRIMHICIIIRALYQEKILWMSETACARHNTWRKSSPKMYRYLLYNDILYNRIRPYYSKEDLQFIISVIFGLFITENSG